MKNNEEKLSLLNEYFDSNLISKEFCKINGVSATTILNWVKKFNLIDKLHVRNKRINENSKLLRAGSGKYSIVKEEIKQKAMSDYIAGLGTVKEIGKKYKFGHRNLAKWFKECGRYDEFINRYKENVSLKPVMLRSELMKKIGENNNIAWNGGIKIEVKEGYIRGVRDRKENQYVHRQIMERILGRALTDEEIVHHITIDSSDNSDNNLLLIKNASAHGLFHIYLQLALVSILGKENMIKLSNELLPIVYEELERRKSC